MLKRYQDLRDFHSAFMLPLDMDWQTFLAERGAFRYALLEEEFDEWLVATRASDRVEQLDALIDVQYIALGTLVEFGGNPSLASPSATNLADEHLTHLVKATQADNLHSFTPESFTAHLTQLIDRVEFIGQNLMFDMQAAFDEVHRSNMAKLGSDGKPLLNGINCPMDSTKPEGKVLKPSGWSAPVLAPFVGV